MTHAEVLSAALEASRRYLDERGHPLPDDVVAAFKEGVEVYRRLVDE